MKKTWLSWIKIESVKMLLISGVIKKDGKIIIIEEDKGSYVDGTFLKRTLVDAATIFDTCITNEIECPYFILSCVTTMKNYQQIYDKVTSLFNEESRVASLRHFCFNEGIPK